MRRLTKLWRALKMSVTKSQIYLEEWKAWTTPSHTELAKAMRRSPTTRLVVY
jgi:hypothetical protein